MQIRKKQEVRTGAIGWQEAGVVGNDISLLFFCFLFSRDLRATSRLVLRRTGSLSLPLGVIRSDRSPPTWVLLSDV